MKGRVILLLGIVAILLLVAGCGFLTNQDPLTMNMEARGHSFGTSLALYPRADEGGVLVTFRLSGASEYEINYGDGSPDETSALGVFHHTYTRAGTFTVEARSGARYVVGHVTVVDHAPEAYPGFLATSCQWMNKMIVDLRYREHGCHNGAPVGVSGAYDIDGDELQYQLTVTGPGRNGDQVKYAVFTPDRVAANGKFVSGGVFVVFPGWTDTSTPPYPFTSPMSSHNPDLPASKPVVLGTVTFHYVVRDQWGLTGETTWTHVLTAIGCHK